jgi:hypothetical protein
MEFQITKAHDVIKQLDRFLKKSGMVISIDGVCPVGRMAVTEEVCSGLRYHAVSAAEFPDTGKLKAKIEEARRTGGVVIEGAQLRRKCSDMSVRSDVSIYVIPSVRSDRRKLFEDILSRGLNECIAELASREDKDIVKYHHTFHPVINADFLVEDGGI